MREFLANVAMFFPPLEQFWWVYLLLFYCIFVGIKASKGGVASFGKMLIMPIVFSYMSIHTLLTSFSLDTFVLLTYISGTVLGVLLGCLQASSHTLAVDRNKSLLQFKGTWSTLFIILAIFISKYYFGYEMSADPKLLQNTHFEFAMLSVSGLVSGMFVGRAIYYFYRLRTSESTDLVED
jgi:hypothetical protein